MARHRLNGSADAEDAVSDAVVAILANPGRLLESPRPAAWVFGVLKHKISDVRRLRQRECELPEELECDDDNGWSAVEAAALVRQVERRLARLPPQQARAIRLHYLSDMDTAEACDVLRVTSSNYFVLQHRGLQALRACLSPRPRHGQAVGSAGGDSSKAASVRQMQRASPTPSENTWPRSMPSSASS